MIRYSIRVDDALAHYAAVRMRVPRAGSEPLDLVLPSWVPGSYWIQDPARMLVDLTAASADAHAALPVERIDKARWRIGGSGDIEVRYRAYGHTASTEGLDVDVDHLFFTGVLCLPYVDGRKAEACELAVEARPGHEIVTELRPVADHPPTFHAPSYDVLADAVVDVGRPTVLRFAPRGIPHRISLCGHGGNYDPHRLTEDVGRIVEAAMRYMGGSPLTGYTFFFHIGEAYDGALEHLDSNSCVLPRSWFRPAPSYERVLFLASHEYFHLYNVKRIRPEVLGPFDYTKEVYSKLLWLMEGTTDYVSNLLLRISGVLPAPKYLERVAKDAQTLLNTPGRHRQSLEEASMLAWIDFYRPYEETVNRSVSYYVKGHLVSLALDLLLRDRTDGRRSMQEVLRYLWTEYAGKDRGLPEGSFPSIVRAATGEEVDAFVRSYIAGTDELDLDASVRPFGLRFEPVPKPPDAAEEGEPGYLGAETRYSEGVLRVTSVRDGTPARQAGLSPGDEIVALDHAKVPGSEFAEFLKRYPPGTEAEITVFRKGWLTTLPVTFGSAPPAKYRFQPLPEATDRQKRLYEGWLGVPWSPAKPADGAKDPSPA